MSERISTKGERNAFRNANKTIIYLTGVLRKSGAKIRIQPVPVRSDLEERREIVDLMQAQVDAIELGIDITGEETTGELEEKIFSALPQILEDRGLIKGAIVRPNFGPRRRDPQRIVEDYEAGGTSMTLKPVYVSGEEQELSAIRLAKKAAVLIAAPVSD